MSKNCNLCNTEVKKLKNICGIDVCDKCYESLVSVMQYKHHKDIIDEDKELLQKFLNNLSKILLDK